MKILTTVIPLFLLMQSTAHAEEPLRSISRSETSPPAAHSASAWP